MDRFNFVFANGSSIRIVLGEDGYNVNIDQVGGKPLMGTFTDFENLLKGIAKVVIANVSSNAELDKFAVEIDLSLSNTMVVDEIKERLTDVPYFQSF